MSTIELDTPSLRPEQIQQLETEVNEKIRAALQVFPTLYPDKAALEADEVGDCVQGEKQRDGSGSFDDDAMET